MVTCLPLIQIENGPAVYIKRHIEALDGKAASHRRQGMHRTPPSHHASRGAPEQALPTILSFCLALLSTRRVGNLLAEGVRACQTCALAESRLFDRSKDQQQTDISLTLRRKHHRREHDDKKDETTMPPALGRICPPALPPLPYSTTRIDTQPCSFCPISPWPLPTPNTGLNTTKAKRRR